MFVSPHDLAALFVVLVAAGGVGAAVGLRLASGVAASARHVGELADRHGSTDADDRTIAPATPRARRAGRAAGHDVGPARPSPRPGSGRWMRRGGSSSPGCRTTCARRWPGSGRWSRRSRTGSSKGHDVDRYYRTLGAEADRLAGLVDDLFELSRIESSALRLTLERVSLGEVVSDALAGAGPVARAKGVRLDGSVHEPVPDGRRRRRRAEPGAAQPARQRHPPHARRRLGDDRGGPERPRRRSSPCTTPAAASPPTRSTGSSTSPSAATPPAHPARRRGRPRSGHRPRAGRGPPRRHRRASTTAAGAASPSGCRMR